MRKGENNLLEKPKKFAISPLGRKNWNSTLFVDETRRPMGLVPLPQRGIGSGPAPPGWRSQLAPQPSHMSRRCAWGPDSLLQKLSWECRQNFVLIQPRQNFLTFCVLKILKQYLVWGLSQVNVAACTSPHPASHFPG